MGAEADAENGSRRGRGQRKLTRKQEPTRTPDLTDARTAIAAGAEADADAGADTSSEADADDENDKADDQDHDHDQVYEDDNDRARERQRRIDWATLDWRLSSLD
jgi:hypothetical protein